MGVTEVILPVGYGLETIPESRLAMTVPCNCVLGFKNEAVYSHHRVVKSICSVCEYQNKNEEI
jgi:hypothetical protein